MLGLRKELLFSSLNFQICQRIFFSLAAREEDIAYFALDMKKRKNTAPILSWVFFSITVKSRSNFAIATNGIEKDRERIERERRKGFLCILIQTSNK